MHPLAAILAPDRTHFVGEVFEGLDLSEQRLESKHFDECVFRDCDLRETRFHQCRLSDTAFESSELTLLKLGDSSLRDVRFRDCRLVGVDWMDAESTLGLGVAFEACILDGSSFVGLDLEGLRLLDCRANEVDFSRAVLKRADFRGTRLARSRFEETDLSGADLSGATDFVVDPRTTRLEGTKVSVDGAMTLLGVLGVELVDAVEG